LELHSPLGDHVFVIAFCVDHWRYLRNRAVALREGVEPPEQENPELKNLLVFRAYREMAGFVKDVEPEVGVQGE